MKAVVYSVKPFEKEYLAKANQKKHDITLISNPLSVETAAYAAGKNAVIISDQDNVSAAVIEKLAALNIRFILTRSRASGHFDKEAAARFQIKLASIAADLPQEIADQTIQNLDFYQLNKCVGDNCACANSCRIIPENLTK